jgi:hypothetical protein
LQAFANQKSVKAVLKGVKGWREGGCLLSPQQLRDFLIAFKDNTGLEFEGFTRAAKANASSLKRELEGLGAHKDEVLDYLAQANTQDVLEKLRELYVGAAEDVREKLGLQEGVKGQFEHKSRPPAPKPAVETGAQKGVAALCAVLEEQGNVNGANATSAVPSRRDRGGGAVRDRSGDKGASKPHARKGRGSPHAWSPPSGGGSSGGEGDDLEKTAENLAQEPLRQSRRGKRAEGAPGKVLGGRSNATAQEQKNKLIQLLTCVGEHQNLLDIMNEPTRFETVKGRLEKHGEAHAFNDLKRSLDNWEQKGSPVEKTEENQKISERIDDEVAKLFNALQEKKTALEGGGTLREHKDLTLKILKHLSFFVKEAEDYPKSGTPQSFQTYWEGVSYKARQEVVKETLKWIEQLRGKALEALEGNEDLKDAWEAIFNQGVDDKETLKAALKTLGEEGYRKFKFALEEAIKGPSLKDDLLKGYDSREDDVVNLVGWLNGYKQACEEIQEEVYTVGSILRFNESEERLIKE